MSQPTADRSCPPQPRPTPAEVLALEQRFVAARRALCDAGDAAWSASSRSGAKRLELLRQAVDELERARRRVASLLEHARRALDHEEGLAERPQLELLPATTEPEREP